METIQQQDIEAIRAARKRWLDRTQGTGANGRRAAQRDGLFTNSSGMQIEPLYDPSALRGVDFARDIGYPGEFPFTRGVYDTMYRGQLWTTRLFSGFANPEQTNARYHYLLERGQTGLSVAFDMPTLMGLDSDHAHSLGEVGRCGVAIDTLEDMEILFKGIPLDKVSVSMTINGPALVLFAMYVVAAERQGVTPSQLRGTIQNDILKEYIAQKEWLFPPEPHMRIIVDMIEWCAREMPSYNPISISGYHIREAGATAVQELAFTLADGFCYVEHARDRGLDVDMFAPRLSFFFDIHNDFFEEIAKLRAARRIWAKHLRDRYGAKNPRSWLMRFHSQTAGVSLTAQQPENNIVRVAYQALAAVLGGTQSLHTNSMDETLALPSEKAARIAMRTQQILAHETGVPDTVDPLAGSYYVESLTNAMEEAAEAYFTRIQTEGGVLDAIRSGFFQREIGRAAYDFQREVEAKKRIIVGVNDFVETDDQIEIPILKIGEDVEQRQSARTQQRRASRDAAACQQALDAVAQASRDGSNLVEPVLEAVRRYATLGEIVEAMRGVFGGYREPAIF
ncbi:MAG: methylmalonyl-CoA mutase [Proteobacteria bacterium]|nr:methylmalonyl-CoA mutase [Pseudomonadota bacterium]